MKTKVQLRNLKTIRLRFRRITFRALLFTLCIIVALIFGFSLWVRYHAEQVLEQIVATQSHNKLKLKVTKFRFNWVNNKIELTGATLSSTDTTAHISYRVDINKITIKARGFLPLLLKREILIDSIRLYSPDITFTKTAPRVKGVKISAEEFSVAKEMGRITKSINDAINVLHIDKFIIDDGSFSLLDKINPESKPFVVTRIQLRLENLQIDKHETDNNKRKDARGKISFTDDIAIQTTHQNITFPSGRHVLSFRSFKVNLKNKRVEFDSCTMRGIKGDSSKSSFNIFFDKLQLTNINFDTLYHAEVIQADSVFCTNPRILFEIDADKEVAKDKKNSKLTPERIDQLIQQLLGDVMLNYVVVNNASINLNTIKKGRNSSFSSHNNNIELQGLQIRQNLEHPLRVSKFLMTLRDYKTKLKDGQYQIAFDSIKFNDDAINLSNFAFEEYANNRTIKHLSMPDFELRGLSWEALLYNNDFNAQSAVLYKPDIDYSSNKNTGRGHKSVFESLGDIGNFLHLRNLTIREGDIDLHLGRQTNLHLLNTDLSLMADELIASKKIKNVQHSINFLQFDKGLFRNEKIQLDLNNVSLSQDKKGLSARQLILKGNNIDATLFGVAIGTVLLDSVNQRILLDQLKWDNGQIQILTNRNSRTGAAKTTLSFNDVHGTNTDVDLLVNGKHIKANLDVIAIASLLQKAGSNPVVAGLAVNGHNLSMNNKEQQLSIGKFAVTDRQNSILNDVRFIKNNFTDSISVTLSQVLFTPDITALINGNINLDYLKFKNPVIIAGLGKKDSAATGNQKGLRGIKVNEILLEQPVISLSIENKASQKSYVSWEGNQQSSYLSVKNLLAVPGALVKADQVKTYLTNFEFTSPKGKRTATNDNKLDLVFNDIELKKDEQDKISWKTKASILSLDNLHFDSLGKKNAELHLNTGSISNIALSSNRSNTISDIINHSPDLLLANITGSLTGPRHTLYWFGWQYHNRLFQIDSLQMIPVQTPEAYHIKKAFNQDLLTIRTGAITGSAFNRTKDSVLEIRKLMVSDMRLINFKDKTQPDSFHRLKPLPVARILQIPVRLNIDSVLLDNMYVEYWERNNMSDKLTIIPTSNMNVWLKNVKNYNLSNTDSLYILATGNVMNSLFTQLETRESYNDISHPFSMKLTTGPVQLAGFNEMLLPLTHTRVRTGILDSLSLIGTADNDFSAGSLRMHYRNLRIAVMNKDNTTKQSFKNRIISWIANTFVIRKNSNGKPELVVFEREKDRSTVSYLIKTAVAGVKAVVGVPGAKRDIKKAGQSREKAGRNR